MRWTHASLAITVHELDWPEIYDENGVVVCSIPAVPPPSVTPRQQAAPGGERYVIPEWIMQRYARETLPVMDKVPKEFKEQLATDFELPLRPKEEK